MAPWDGSYQSVRSSGSTEFVVPSVMLVIPSAEYSVGTVLGKLEL